MREGGFQFRQFFVRHDRCAMKVGTDGVLLGAWALGGRRILDIGTGTGLIALMLAQRFPDATVDGIDIDPSAVNQARENVEKSPFAGKICISRCAVQQYQSACYDAIVSNPPYFQNSLKNPNAQRSAARHTDSLSYRELFAAVSRLLSDAGVFSAIIPYDCMNDFADEAVFQGLMLLQACAVKTTPKKQPKRCLLAFGKRAEGNLKCETKVMMTADGERSEWYRLLTKDFYL